MRATVADRAVPHSSAVVHFGHNNPKTRDPICVQPETRRSRDYSRSIGTDVRYMLLLIGKYDGAQWLVDEMVGGASG